VRAIYAGAVSEQNPTRVRIRWGWFVGCILLGLLGILAGMALAPDANKAGYVSGVLGGVGTTLLLIGVVVLLERRIVDTAARVFRNAAEEAQERADREMRSQINDLEARLAKLWTTETTTAEDAARRQEMTRRLTDEFTKRVVDETAEDYGR
jgi:hypothetical protein